MSVGPPAGPPTGPPSGPPSGPPRPPAGPPPGGPARPPGSAPQGLPKWLLPVIGVAVVVVLIAVVASSGGGKKSGTASGGEIFLEPIADTGTDPFTSSTASKPPKTTIPPDTAVTITKNPPQTAPSFPKQSGPPKTGGGTVAVQPRSGGTPGLYGGTGDQKVCDKQQMIDFLTNDTTKGAAWADAQGIPESQLASYLDSLTPAVLRSDTRVTNHGFKNGRATPHQSVLQAGTAVLVDNRGVPRARCACGNPLLPPNPVPSAPTFTGSAWPGFDPGNVTVIEQSPTVINIITVINVIDGTPYGQPTGPGNPAPVPLPGSSSSSSSTSSSSSSSSSSSRAACPSRLQLLETLQIDTRNTTGDTSHSYPPGCGYQVVISGEADLNVNNSFSGGFDSHYCYDPQYCSTTKLNDESGGLRINGELPWLAFQTQPPAFDSTHTYTYVSDSLPGNQIALTFNDSEYSDNRGGFTVQIFSR